VTEVEVGGRNASPGQPMARLGAVWGRSKVGAANLSCAKGLGIIWAAPIGAAKRGAAGTIFPGPNEGRMILGLPGYCRIND
jgi:hypothetical protein